MYFTKPDYLVDNIEVATVTKYTDSILIDGTKIFTFSKFFPRVIGYSPEWVTCHHIVAIGSLTNNMVMTTYLSVKLP